MRPASHTGLRSERTGPTDSHPDVRGIGLGTLDGLTPSVPNSITSRLSCSAIGGASRSVTLFCAANRSRKSGTSNFSSST